MNGQNGVNWQATRVPCNYTFALLVKKCLVAVFTLAYEFVDPFSIIRAIQGVPNNLVPFQSISDAGWVLCMREYQGYSFFRRI